MSLHQAERLVHEVLGDRGNEHALEPYEPLSPEFYGFEVVVSNPGGSAVIGGYMVNPWNGDVWNSSDPCHLVETPALKKLQEAVGRRLRLSKEELVVANALKPFCADSQ